MTAIVLPRQYGVVVTCNACGAREQTALAKLRNMRTWLVGLGWGRGSDKGAPFREPRAAKPAVRDSGGCLLERAQRARHEITERPRTTSHDLCPPCLAKDRAAAKARKKAWLAGRARGRTKRNAGKP